MAQTPEGRVKAAVKKLLKQRGIWYFMPMQNGYGVVGIPDLICCWDGEFLAIETKAPGKKSSVTANQRNRLDEIASSGGHSLVIDDVGELESYLNGREEAKKELR